MILVLNKDGLRLCQDNLWRGFANFGSFPECVKTYKVLGHARRKAKRVKGSVVQIPEGVTVEAGGFIYDSKGQRQWSEFLVHSAE